MKAQLELTAIEAIEELLQVNKPFIQTDEVNNIPEAQRVDIIVKNLITNITESSIQSNKKLLNQVTAPHHQGTQARLLTKHAVKADTDAEASQ